MEMERCIQNKTIYLLGDSTLRQWFSIDLQKRFNCSISTEAWTNDKWHKPTECTNRISNLTIVWYPHSQPFFVGDGFDKIKYTLKSIARYIDDIEGNENAIVVVHVFCHNIPFHPNVFRIKIQTIRDAVKRLLTRNPIAKVLIKGPHSFKNSPPNPRWNDMFGLVYANILYEEFIELHDKVYYLNNRDATDAQQTEYNHPEEYIVWAMVSQMLTFACS
ncbi:NXPE family member 2-like [Mya arenaria]|uniref:NXPE family member 2-like n=1 Tax=Mya arenaria TaxID=6604 RepID=UPI0022E6A087|nr:NXPE family member 2-like [Mya arenaria]